MLARRIARGRGGSIGLLEGRFVRNGITVMTIILVLLIGAFVIAAAIALVRGLTAFFRDGEKIRSGAAASDEQFGLMQNRMMFQRVLFQGIAILLVGLIGLMASQG